MCQTSLLCAAEKGRLEVVTLLVNAGAAINIQNNVSTRTRLCVQTMTIHMCIAIKQVNRYNVLIDILYLMVKITISSYNIPDIVSQ